MTEPAKCSNDGCPKEHNCQRAQMPATPCTQRYRRFEPTLNRDGTVSCEHFHPMVTARVPR